MKTGYYLADTNNGIYFETDTLEDPDRDVLSPSDFYKDLSSVGDNEVICTFFGPSDEEIFLKIKKEYGIN